MNKAQRVTISIACIAIFAVNCSFIFPRFYMGRYHAVGPDTVSVRLATPESTSPTVLISETGQRVAVYLSNGYRNNEIQFAPRLTLALLVGFGLMYAIASRITGRSCVPTHSERTP